MTRGTRSLSIALVFFCAARAEAQESPVSHRLPGLPTTIPGLYLSEGTAIADLAAGRFQNLGFEYSPEEFGFSLEQDFQGEYRASQARFFLGIGLTPNLAIAFRASAADARFNKDASDSSALPEETKESGLEALSAELVWRFLGTDGGETEFFLLTQFVIPHDGDKLLLAQDGLAVLPQIGVIRAFPWAVIEGRLGLEYDAGSETPFDVGRWNVQLLRELVPTLRIGVGLDGQIGGANNFDEVWFVSHLQWAMSSNVILRASSDLGLTALTKGWSPQLGAIVRLPF